GAADAPFFINQESAEHAAIAGAYHAAHRRAVRYVALARCPSCRARGRRAMAGLVARKATHFLWAFPISGSLLAFLATSAATGTPAAFRTLLALGLSIACLSSLGLIAMWIHGELRGADAHVSFFDVRAT